MFQKLYSGSFYPTLVFFIISTLVIPWIAQAPELKRYPKLHLAAVHSTSRMHRHSILVYHLPGAHIVLLCWVSGQHPNQWACFCFWLLSTFLNIASYNIATMKSQYLPKLARLTQLFLPKAWFLPLAYDFHCSLRLAAHAGMPSWRPSMGSFILAWPGEGWGGSFPRCLCDLLLIPYKYLLKYHFLRKAFPYTWFTLPLDRKYFLSSFRASYISFTVQQTIYYPCLFSVIL